MDFLNVATFGTSSSSTKVLVLDGNTVKSRTASQVVTDGGGGGSSGKSFQMTLFGAKAIGNIGSYDEIWADQAANGYGWPWNIDTVNQPATSLSQAVKFIVPFNPTNCRISALCVYAPSYFDQYGDPLVNAPTSGDFGIKFQWSTDNTSWSTGNPAVDNDIVTIGFRGKTAGQLATVTATPSISGSPSLIYVRCVISNTLPNQTTGYQAVNSFIANFWN
jgi:hypothetical protein